MADIVYNYVKFMRGTPTAFKNLVPKNKDTLYFIHEEDAITGQLYIGDILISDNLENDSSAIIAKLSDLEDVNITGVVDKQVLGYDANTSKWIPVTLEQAIDVAPMIGATADTDGAEGLVPAPKAGDEGKFGPCSDPPCIWRKHYGADRNAQYPTAVLHRALQDL